MGAMSRRKGAQFEREVAQSAREAGFVDAYREAPLQAGHGVRFADVGAVGRLLVECKRYAKGSLTAGKGHVLGDEVPGFMRVAVCRDNGEPALAVLRWDDLLKLERDARRAVVPAGTEAVLFTTGTH